MEHQAFAEAALPVLRSSSLVMQDTVDAMREVAEELDLLVVQEQGIVYTKVLLLRKPPQERVESFFQSFPLASEIYSYQLLESAEDNPLFAFMSDPFANEDSYAAALLLFKNHLRTLAQEAPEEA